MYSILQTPGDLKSVGGGTVILITDGEESCKGDFAAAAKTLKDSGLNLTLNIVGFTLKSAPAQAQLSGLAESTGGHYYGASSGEALARAVLLAAVDQAALSHSRRGRQGSRAAVRPASTQPHELPRRQLHVVITAAEQELRTPVTVAVGQDIVLKALDQGRQVGGGKMRKPPMSQRVRRFTVLTSLAVLVLAGGVALAQTVLAQLGETEASARTRILAEFDNGGPREGGSLGVAALGAYAKLSPAVRGQVTAGFYAWTKTYVNSAAFKKAYADKRTEVMPQPRPHPGTVDEELKATLDAEEGGVRERRQRTSSRPG